MAESTALVILRNKRAEIVSVITAYEDNLKTARIDLTHINAAIRLFEVDDPGKVRPYADVARLFQRKEIATLCEGWIKIDGPLDTRQLTLRLMELHFPQFRAFESSTMQPVG